MKHIIFYGLCFYSMMSFAQSSESEIFFHKADSLFEARNWKGAVKAYQSGLKTDTLNGLVWYRLGEAYQAEGSYNEAIKSYKKSLEFKIATIPMFIIRICLAKTYSQNKDSASALDLLTRMTGNGYSNFSDLSNAKEYEFLRSSSRFLEILSKARSNAFPCLDNPHNREFDFWVGNWNVYQTGTHFQVGKSRIENTTGGCLILENWTAVDNPDEGKSMNFINPITGKWEQHYMGISGASLYYYNGEYKENAMRFEGDGLDKSGNKLVFHLTFFNLGPDEVRQLFEQTTDQGKTWTTLYDFTYMRII